MLIHICTYIHTYVRKCVQSQLRVRYLKIHIFRVLLVVSPIELLDKIITIHVPGVQGSPSKGNSLY